MFEVNDQKYAEFDADNVFELYDMPIEIGAPEELAPGVFWLRTPLPFALDHINLWMLEDGDGWVIVDTGIKSAKTKAIWEAVEKSWIGGRPVNKIICTHHHPDHVGLAGWLQTRHSAALYMTHREWLTGRVFTTDKTEETEHNSNEFYRMAGLENPDKVTNTISIKTFSTLTTPLPRSFVSIRHRDKININGHEWHVIVGSGHSPEHACLYSKFHKLLISGDQVLPGITPNISVPPAEPYANPLLDFLRSLILISELPSDTTVLPSHGLPFQGLRRRIVEIGNHHLEHLAHLRQVLEPDMTIRDATRVLFPRTSNDMDLRLATGETAAHLNYLLAQGSLQRQTDGDGLWRYVLT